MRHMICVGKTRAPDGVIIGYELEEPAGEPGKKSYGIEYLRRAVDEGEISISNLHPDPYGSGFLPVGMKPPSPVILGEKPPADSKPVKLRRARKSKRHKRGRR